MAQFRRKIRGIQGYDPPTRGMGRPSLQELVRARLRETCDHAGFTQVQVADHLHTEKSSISKLFRPDGTNITLRTLEGFSSLLQRTPAELVADPAAAILPVSQLEHALLDRFRRMTELQRMSLMTVLDWRGEAAPIGGRQRKHLSHDETVLVALWQAADRAPDVRSKVLDLLRQHPAEVE